MPYLIKQHNTYSARWRIPDKDRPKFGGKKELKKSLETGDKKLAQMRAYQVVARWKQQAEGSLWDRERAKYPDEGEPHVIGVVPNPRSSEISLGNPDLTDELIEEINALPMGKEITEPFDPEKHMKADLVDSPASSEWIEETLESDDWKVATGQLVRFRDHLEPWAKQLTTKPKTVSLAKADVSSFIKDFPYPHLVTRRKLKEWLEGQGKAQKTLSRALGSIRQFWTYVEIELDRDDLTTTDPFRNLTVVGNKGVKTVAFTRVELEEIYQSLDSDDLRLLVQTAALTGMRIEEIMSSTFDGASRTIIVSDSKTDAGVRTIPLHSALDADAISEMQEKYPPVGAEGRRSDAIGKQINRRLVRLGYEGREKTFHSIRKYVATCFENEGVDELKASRILGHNLQTMSYGLYSGGHDVEGLRDVIEVLQPLS